MGRFNITDVFAIGRNPAFHFRFKGNLAPVAVMSQALVVAITQRNCLTVRRFGLGMPAAFRVVRRCLTGLHEAEPFADAAGKTANSREICGVFGLLGFLEIRRHIENPG